MTEEQKFPQVIEKVYDLSNNRDLMEIESMCSRPDKFEILVDETIQLPFRHMRVRVIK